MLDVAYSVFLAQWFCIIRSVALTIDFFLLSLVDNKLQ